MNAATLYTGIVEMFRNLSGVVASAQKGGRFQFAPKSGSRARLDVNILSVRSLGQDEVIGAYDPDAEIEGDEYEPNPDDPEERLGGIVFTLEGVRQIVVEVMITAERQDATALPHTEGIRDRLELPSSVAALEALGLGVARIGPTRSIDFPGPDKRELSAYVFEVTLNAGASATDAPVTTIETVTPEFDAES
jgi:hypothetical protein